MITDYKLKDVTLDDLETLKEIGSETFYETYEDGSNGNNLNMYLNDTFSTKTMTDQINNPDSRFKLMICNDQVVGYLKFNVGSAQTEPEGDDSFEVERIYIKKAFRSYGLGTKSIEYAINHARKLNKNFIWLGGWEHNEPAKKFYTKMGFKPFSEHQFTLGDEFQRDILMKKCFNFHF